LQRKKKIVIPFGYSHKTIFIVTFFKVFKVNQKAFFFIFFYMIKNYFLIIFPFNILYHNKIYIIFPYIVYIVHILLCNFNGQDKSKHFLIYSNNISKRDESNLFLIYENIISK